jgi:hypothetical protein
MSGLKCLKMAILARLMQIARVVQPQLKPHRMKSDELILQNRRVTVNEIAKQLNKMC